ncbi:hypothetical protein VNI00_018884, partial [Paramarasmius palmivorus]
RPFSTKRTPFECLARTRRLLGRKDIDVEVIAEIEEVTDANVQMHWKPSSIQNGQSRWWRRNSLNNLLGSPSPSPSRFKGVLHSSRNLQNIRYQTRWQNQIEIRHVTYENSLYRPGAQKTGAFLEEQNRWTVLLAFQRERSGAYTSKKRTEIAKEARARDCSLEPNLRALERTLEADHSHVWTYNSEALPASRPRVDRYQKR